MFVPRMSVLLLMLLSVGCARYEFDIVRPPDLAQHIGRKQDAVAPLPPLEYRMRTVEGRLAMAIVNQSGEPITLRGAESFVVDPRGRSHPVRSQTIAPGSYIKLIFPPLPPRVRPSGPSFGIGIGTMIGSSGYPSRRYRHHPYGHHFAEPRYYAVYDDDEDEGRYWDWDGESEVRISLVYDHGGHPLNHQFVIMRKKV